MPPLPDMQGFFEAQTRLIRSTGSQVVLMFAVDDVWPPGTKLDPESGEPLDPWAVPISSGYASCAVSAAVGRRPANPRLQSKLQFEPVGVGQGDPGQLIIAADDYPAASGDASKAIVQGREMKVENTTFQSPFRYVLDLEPT